MSLDAAVREASLQELRPGDFVVVGLETQKPWYTQGPSEMEQNLRFIHFPLDTAVEVQTVFREPGGIWSAAGSFNGVVTGGPAGASTERPYGINVMPSDPQPAHPDPNRLDEPDPNRVYRTKHPIYFGWGMLRLETDSGEYECNVIVGRRIAPWVIADMGAMTVSRQAAFRQST